MPANGRIFYPNGNYSLQESIHALNKDFTSEKELSDYIEANIILFTSDCLGFTYKEHKREWYINPKARGNSSKRMDFLIITSDNKRIGVECKNPYYPSEVTGAVAQSLSYLALTEMQGAPLDLMVILSTKIDAPALYVIDKFNLPIKFIGFDKDKFLTFNNGSTPAKSVLETAK